jgi:sensor histidine kinase YesM
MQRAEFKQLQSQINPHFLNNSITTQNIIARIGDENLILFTKHLGEYKNLKIQQLIIKPFITNAAKHSMEKEKAMGILSVTFKLNMNGS